MQKVGPHNRRNVRLRFEQEYFYAVVRLGTEQNIQILQISVNS
jgi:hypothetical protein